MMKVFRTPLWLGVIGATVLAIGSYGGGAVRYRGGVLDALGWSFLAFGHGAGMFNALFGVGIVLIVVTWAQLGRSLFSTPDAVTADSIQRCVWAWIIPLLFAAPMLSRDVYSYLMQGAMQRDGFDPYSEGVSVNPGPMMLEVSHDWRNTTTPYGPLHLGIGNVITTIVGDNVTLGVVLYKLVSIAGFALIMWSVPAIARLLGGNPALAMWLGVANPVMYLHLIGGMHNESLMVGLVCAGLLLALRRRYVMGVALIGVAVALKATAIIAMPFVVWMLMRFIAAKWDGRRYPLAFVLAGLWVAVETMVAITVVTILSGSSWGWVSQLSGNSKVINPLAFPSLLASVATPFAIYINDDITFNQVLGWCRVICQVLMLAGLVVVWWRYRRTDQDAIKGTTAAYGVAVVFNTVTLPWYYTSLLSLIGTFQPSRRLVVWTTGLSILVALMFTGSGNHKFYDIPWVAAAVLASYLLTRYIFGRHGIPTQGSAAKTPEPAPAA